MKNYLIGFGVLFGIAYFFRNELSEAIEGITEIPDNMGNNVEALWSYIENFFGGGAYTQGDGFDMIQYWHEHGLDAEHMYQSVVLGNITFLEGYQNLNSVYSVVFGNPEYAVAAAWAADELTKYSQYPAL